MMTSVFQRIGPFEILSEIGRGGMATVFLAADSRSGARVALKLVPVGHDRDAREILEAEQSGAVLHDQFSKVCDRVPAVYEYKTDGQYFYIAMEYVEGENLSDVIARGPLQPDRAIAIAIELCRVLELAHEFETTIGERRFRSLIHGDLKPRNVRLTSDRQIKVLDFGIAKALSLSRRVARNDFGSMAYLSPERLESNGEVDAQADCWAVGVLLYEMLGGEQPFRGTDTRQLERRITSRQRPEPLTARCPAALQAILDKLLAPRTTDRYACAGAIREDLERFIAGRATEAERHDWAAVSRDEAATRRTRPVMAPGATSATRPSADEAPTQRTPKPGLRPPPLAAASAAPVPPRPYAPVAVKRRPLWGRLRAGLMLLAVFLVVNEACVATQVSRLRGPIASSELDTLGSVWSEYDELKERSYLGFAVRPVERSLARHTAVLTDRIIDRYRAGSAVVWEPEWEQARRALLRAEGLPGNNPNIRASLRYCEGHIDRINGEARKARKEFDDARQYFAGAVTAFREAAELRPDWPDPFLGLARTFIYGLEDVDRGADALKQAQRRGHKTGERETSQLADGFRRRAESLARTARRLQGLPQEQEYLSRAAEAYEQALSLYGALITVDAAASIRQAQNGLARVSDRLAEMADQASALAAVPDGPWRPEQPDPQLEDR